MAVIKKRLSLILVDLLLFVLLILAYHNGGDDARPVMGALDTETAVTYKGKLALTFDDGPHPYFTEQILDALQERGIKATFFVTGQNAEQYPEVVKRIVAEGHILGNHTYYHTQLTARNTDKFVKELNDTNALLEKITGCEVIYVRPPYGSWNKKLEKSLDMIPLFWTLDPLDWCQSNVDCITQNVTVKVKENDIILLHDYYKSTVKATMRIIARLSREGYEFVTVEEILF